MRPILLDCDTGIDDAVALTYLACLHSQGSINLAAVTTTGGYTTMREPPDVIRGPGGGAGAPARSAASPPGS